MTDGANVLAESDETDVDFVSESSVSWRRRTALIMLLAGALGLTAALVLSVDAWLLAKDSEAHLACDVSRVVSCSEVARSWQARLLGFPNAFLGIVFESVVLTVSVSLVSGITFPRWFIRGVHLFYTGGLFFALWLFQQSYFVIHALCPWCLVITFTTTIVWAGLTRIAVRDGHLPVGEGARRFVASGADWYVTGAVLIVLITMILVRYGTRLFLA